MIFLVGIVIPSICLGIAWQLEKKRNPNKTLQMNKDAKKGWWNYTKAISQKSWDVLKEALIDEEMRQNYRKYWELITPKKKQKEMPEFFGVRFTAWDKITFS